MAADRPAHHHPATRAAPHRGVGALGGRAAAHGRAGRARPGRGRPLPRGALGRRRLPRQRPRDPAGRGAGARGVAVASRRRQSSASVLLWLGMLHYGVYNYAYYSFGGRSARRSCCTSRRSSPPGCAPHARHEHRRRAAPPRAWPAVRAAASSLPTPRSSVSRWSPRGAGCRCASPSPATCRADVMPAVGRPPRLRHRPLPAGARLPRGRHPPLAPRAVGVGARGGRQREWGDLPRRPLGGRRFPGGCRDRGQDVALTRGDRVGARLPGRDAGTPRATAPAAARGPGARGGTDAAVHARS